MKILIACEFSGVVRDAFIRKGHTAISCDLEPSSSAGPHFIGDVRNHIRHADWDMLIAHPPCTALCVSGNRHYAGTQDREDAIEFFKFFLEANVEHICVENPVGVISTRIRRPDQYIQPYQFGHPESKRTGLWLKNLPPLQETNNVYEEYLALPTKERNRIHYMAPGPDRGRLRSVTYQGIADAMAEQWG